MHPTQAVVIFGNISTPFATLASINIHGKFYGDRPGGTPLAGELNAHVKIFVGPFYIQRSSPKLKLSTCPSWAKDATWGKM